jgi:hypothetical protein
VELWNKLHAQFHEPRATHQFKVDPDEYALLLDAARKWVELGPPPDVHGQLLLHSRPAAPGISFRISAAALWSSLVYAAVVLALSVPAALVHPLPLLERSIEIAAFAGFALLGGLALAGIRERSQSLWPCALVQLAGAIGAGALWRWLGTAT